MRAPAVHTECYIDGRFTASMADNLRYAMSDEDGVENHSSFELSAKLNAS